MSLTFPLEPFYDRDVSTLKHFPKGVIVFDRDGTLVEDAGQHNKKELLKFLPDAVEAIKILSDLEFGIVIASNQSGLESGKFSIDDLLEFNTSLRLSLKEQRNLEIDLIVVCPHLASTKCNCRKPRVGLLEAIENTGLGKLKLFIGNSESDRAAATEYKLEYIHTDGTGLAICVNDWLGAKCD
jgi:D-glycero-D-manno-heptose 1,7-bisphosphate phosphatase